MARDHRVRIRTREDIAKIAMAWWLLATRRGHFFDICSFVLGPLTKLHTSKGRLDIEFYEADYGDDPAYVSFKPLTLHVDKKIWEQASKGDPFARYVIAHEVGHILLHDEFAVAFSDEEAARLKYVQKEESGEWQAHTFAELFLVPDHVALKLADADLIAGLCVVSDDLGKRRLTQAKSEKTTIAPQYEGDPCGECGSFSLLRNGPARICDTCGKANPR
ncbi:MULTISPECIES: ImmA/IrrE family metallo-endopeptidase [unclassified Bradyrhizobium]|uniref:ImmA/IrrE family metallo-endopeptidase n=1 Tax=unclassified Bradyrhizobium TaxID=2631580 RepID=UPI0028EFA122|nr:MULTISPECIES: ImmA/IrrE family metallo-endopeptidase [unclassified Bradyrhizobium]